MPARQVVWLLCLPLAAAGWLAGHFLAYEVVAPHAHARDHLLETSGHGYMDAAPVLLACALALAVTGAALALRDGVRGHAGAASVPRWIALLPAAGFVVQEFVERLLHTGELPVGTVFEATFALGVALQVPLGVLAVALARAIHALAHTLGRRLSLCVQPSCIPWAPAPAVPVADGAKRPRHAVLAGGHAGRAPPCSAVVR